MDDTRRGRRQDWAHFTPHLPEVIAGSVSGVPLAAGRARRCSTWRAEDIWVLSRYDDIVAAARDPRRFSQTESVGYSRYRAVAWGSPRSIRRDHTEMRRLTAPLFRPRAVRSTGRTPCRLLDDLLDTCSPHPSRELRRGGGQPVPVAAGRRT